MLGRSEIFRAAAIVALIAVAITALVVTNRRHSAPIAETASDHRQPSIR